MHIAGCPAATPTRPYKPLLVTHIAFHHHNNCDRLPARSAEALEYLGRHFRVVLDLPPATSDFQAGLQLLRDYVFIHLTNPADKLGLLVRRAACSAVFHFISLRLFADVSSCL